VNGWLGGNALRERILRAEIPVPVKYQAIVTLEDGIRVAASWLLHFLLGGELYERIGDGRDSGAGGHPYREAMDIVKRLLPDIGTFAYRRVQSGEATLVKAGLPKDIAADVAWASQYSKALPIAELAAKTQRPVEVVARAYLRCGQETGMADLLIRMAMQASTDRWEAQALRSLRASLRRTMLLLTEKSLAAGPEATLSRDPAFAQVSADVHRLHANPNDPVPVSMFIVIGERLHKAVMRL
jgi:NAD-specific glutamate dehydrogenase